MRGCGEGGAPTDCLEDTPPTSRRSGPLARNLTSEQDSRGDWAQTRSRSVQGHAVSVEAILESSGNIPFED